MTQAPSPNPSRAPHSVRAATAAGTPGCDERAFALRDGGEVVVRPIQPDDGDALRAGFSALSAASRYSRFLSHVPSLSPELVRYLTSVDGVDHVALVAVSASLDLRCDTGLGVARFIRLDEEPSVAEVAVTVVDAVRRRGVARVLLRELSAAARARGIRAFRAEAWAENDAITGLVREFGGSVVARHGETIVVEVPLAERVQASAASRAFERLRRAHGAMPGR